MTTEGYEWVQLNDQSSSNKEVHIVVLSIERSQFNKCIEDLRSSLSYIENTVSFYGTGTDDNEKTYVYVSVLLFYTYITGALYSALTRMPHSY